MEEERSGDCEDHDLRKQQDKEESLGCINLFCGLQS